MYLEARRLLIAVCLAAVFSASPIFGGKSHSYDLVGDITVLVADMIELLYSEDGGEEIRTWETTWSFAGTAEPDPTGPDDGPIPEDPIP